MKPATNVRIACLAALVVGVFAVVGWYVVAVTRPTGFAELRAAAVTGRASGDVRSTREGEGVPPSVGAADAPPSEPDADAIELSELIGRFPHWALENFGSRTIRGSEPVGYRFTPEDRLVRANQCAERYRSWLDGIELPGPPDAATAAAARRALDAYAARLLSGELRFGPHASTNPSTDECLPVLLLLASALQSRDEPLFVAAALVVLDAYDPRDVLASGAAVHDSWHHERLIGAIRGMTYAACEEGLLGEESLRALAEVVAAKRVRPEELDDLWVRYCVSQTEELVAEARALELPRNTWGYFWDGRPNRAIASAMLPVYENKLEALGVAWASRDIAEIERCSAEEEALRRRINLDVAPYRRFDGKFTLDVPEDRHPLDQYAQLLNDYSTFPLEARIAAERWSIRHGGAWPESLDDIVPEFLAVSTLPEFQWPLYSFHAITWPDGRPSFAFANHWGHSRTVAWFADGDSFRAFAESVLGALPQAAPTSSEVPPK